jgi:hypothetical protein
MIIGVSGNGDGGTMSVADVRGGLGKEAAEEERRLFAKFHKPV